MEQFSTNLNDMAFLADKLENYKAPPIPVLGVSNLPWPVQANTAGEDPDKAVLTTAEWPVDEAAQAQAQSFVETMYAELDLETHMKANYKANYTDKGVSPADPADAETRLICFDGDYFRRVFPLLLAPHNQDDVVAYLQYKIIMWGGNYCTKELDDEIFDFHSRKLGGQKEQKSNEKRTVAKVNAWVGELLGKVSLWLPLVELWL
jgi:predicted metalloendopeptidase